MSMDRSRMPGGTGLGVLLVVALLAALAGCGGGDDSTDKAKAPAKPVDGTFVGKVSGTKAFVAVVALPAAGKEAKRDVRVYVTDGQRLSEWFKGSVVRNGFTATSEDRDAKADGELSAKGVTGEVKLPSGRTVKYKATRATGAAGLYDLTVSSDGKLSGASAAGIGLKGRATLTEGKGSLKLADGERHRFDVEEDSAGEASRLKAGQVRVIILGDGQLRGAGKPRPAGGAGDDGFFIRSSS
jgi:hypothetical protein